MTTPSNTTPTLEMTIEPGAPYLTTWYSNAATSGCIGVRFDVDATDDEIVTRLTGHPRFAGRIALIERALPFAADGSVQRRRLFTAG